MDHKKELIFKVAFLNLLINPFCIPFYKSFIDIFFKYIKASKILSAKYYQENKEDCKKKLVKDTKIFLKQKKKKINNMVANVTKIS